MTDTLSIGATRSVADGKIKTFRRLLIINLVLQSVMALGFLFFTNFMLNLFGFDPSVTGGFTKIWAGTLIFASVIQIPSWLSPIPQRITIVIGIIGRAMMTVIYLCLGGSFYLFALYDGLFLVLLAVTFYRMIVAELMTRP